MPTDPPTAEAVAALFTTMPPEERARFFGLIALSAADVHAAVKALPPAEHVRIDEHFANDLIRAVVAETVSATLEVMEERPQLRTDRTALVELVAAKVDHSRKKLADSVAADLKARRDRKPDVATAKRNLEMCELHRKNPVDHSAKRLARRYRLHPDRVRSILRQEKEWRRQLGQG